VSAIAVKYLHVKSVVEAVNGCLVPMSVVMVVEKLASLFKAVASSFKVSSAAGAELTRAAMAVDTKDCVAYGVKSVFKAYVVKLGRSAVFAYGVKSDVLAYPVEVMPETFIIS